MMEAQDNVIHMKCLSGERVFLVGRIQWKLNINLGIRYCEKIYWSEEKTGDLEMYKWFAVPFFDSNLHLIHQSLSFHNTSFLSFSSHFYFPFISLFSFLVSLTENILSQFSFLSSYPKTSLLLHSKCFLPNVRQQSPYISPNSSPYPPLPPPPPQNSPPSPPTSTLPSSPSSPTTAATPPTTAAMDPSRSPPQLGNPTTWTS